MSSIPFDLTHIRAFLFDIDGVLSRSTTLLGEDGNPMRTVNVKDGYALQYAAKRGYIIGIITGGYIPAMEVRMAHLGIEEYHQQSRNKMRDLKEIIERHHLSPEEILYVGDDIPDLEVMQYVGLAIAPADAAIEAKEVAQYISPLKGGEGIAREVIEQTLRAQNVWRIQGEGLNW